MTNDTADTSHQRTIDRVPRLRDLPPSVWALTLARAVNRMGAFTLPFLGVVLTTELGVPLTTTGWLLALFGLATIPSRLAGGALADRLGRPRTILLGLVGTALAQLWLAASHSLPAAVAGTLALGLCFEVYEPPSQALIADATDEQTRPLAYGLLASGLAAAGVAAGLLAAWLGGIDLRWLLVADAVTCLACAATVAVVVRANLPPTSGPSSIRGREVWTDPRLLLMLASNTVFALLYLQVTLALPLTLVARDLPAAHAGLLFTVSALTIVAGQPLLRMLPAVGRSRFCSMTVGYAVLALGLAGTGLATDLSGFVMSTVVWSLGDLVLLGHTWSIVSDLAPAGATARYLAVYGLSWGLAAVFAPLLGTQLLAHGGPVLLWSVSAALAAALAVSQPALARCCTP